MPHLHRDGDVFVLERDVTGELDVTGERSEVDIRLPSTVSR